MEAQRAGAPIHFPPNKDNKADGATQPICKGAGLATAIENDRFLSQLVREFLRRLAWGSMVGASFVFLLVYSSAWRSAAAAFAHADFAAAAWISEALTSQNSKPPQSGVITLAIGEQGYSQRFHGSSPLDRAALQTLAGEVLAATSAVGSVLVVDLDVSPKARSGDAGGMSLDALDQLWVANRGRVVLAVPAAGESDRTMAWVRRLCAQGVAFGRAEAIEIYGLLDLGHDVDGSLAQVASAMVTRQPGTGAPATYLAAGGAKAQTCANTSTGTFAHNRHASSAVALANPVSLPVMGGDQHLANLLKAMAPKVVVLGGTWGHGDSFRTPFGPRFGVDVHAAKVVGYLQGSRTVPSFLQVLLAVFAAAITVTVARRVAKALVGARHHKASVMASSGEPAPGHKVELREPLKLRGQLFYWGTGSRFVVFLAAISMLVAMFMLAALVNAWLGIWVPTMILFGFSAVSLTADWSSRITPELQLDAVVADTGQDKDRSSDSLRSKFIAPVWRHITHAGSAAMVLMLGGRAGGDQQFNGRGQALYELTGSLLAVLGSTAVPAMAFAYLLLR